MIAELDVYSGRPNPRWLLTEDECRELALLLRDLPPAEERRAGVGLGYRGIILANPQKEWGLPPHLRVYAGVVSAEADGAQFLSDVRGCEQRLLTMAAARGYGPLVAAIVQQREA
ncbi:MAG: hypothetical protein ABFD77_10430 [Thermotogota bacterium]